MALEINLHALLQPDGRFIISPDAPDAPFSAPAFFFGDTITFRVFAWHVPPFSRALKSFDLAGYAVELTLGNVANTPDLGFFTLAFDGGAAGAPIPVTAIPSAVETLLPSEGVTVTGSPGAWVITSDAVGARDTPVAVFVGNEDSTPLVTVITGGTTTTPAQWRVSLPENAPAKVGTGAWTTGSVTPASVLTDDGGGLWTLAMDNNARSGFFRLVCGGVTTEFVPFGASPVSVQSALRRTAGGVGSIVIADQVNGGYSIALAADATTLTLDDSTLTIPPSLTGRLDLTTQGLRNLIGSGVFAPCVLSLQVFGSQAGALVTFASSGAFISLPVQPSSYFGEDVTPSPGFDFFNLPRAPFAALTGGGATALDGMTTLNTVSTNSLAFSYVSGLLRAWMLIASTAAEDPAAGIVRPDDYSASNQRVWSEVSWG